MNIMQKWIVIYTPNIFLSIKDKMTKERCFTITYNTSKGNVVKVRQTDGGRDGGRDGGSIHWGVLIYKSVSGLNVTIVQPRDMNFSGRTTFIGSNFFINHFACVKIFPFNFLVFQKKTKKKT